MPILCHSLRVCICLMCIVSFAGLKKNFSRLFKGSFLITKVTDKNLVIDWFFFFLLNLSGGLWQSWLREVSQFPERGWLRNSGWPRWCSLHPNVLVRMGLGLGASGELSFPFPGKPYPCPFFWVVAGLDLMWCTGRLAYPDDGHT